MSLLPTWDPIRLEQKIPFNLALCGGRRQGKSTSLADLLHRMSGRFALVIAFIGSAACNPVLEELMSLHWDPRVCFSASTRCSSSRRRSSGPARTARS